MNTFIWEDLVISKRDDYEPKGSLRAYCDSFTCAKRTENGSISNSIGIEKNVPLGTDFCPNCQSALFWSRSAYTSKKSKMNKFKISEEKNES